MMNMVTTRRIRAAAHPLLNVTTVVAADGAIGNAPMRTAGGMGETKMVGMAVATTVAGAVVRVLASTMMMVKTMTMGKEWGMICATVAEVVALAIIDIL